MRRLLAIAAISAVSLVAVACFHRIYNDPHACYTSADCTDPSIGSFCLLGVCEHTPPDGFDFDGFPGDLPPKSCTASSECSIPSQPICDLQNAICRGCSPSAGGPNAECVKRNADRPICAMSGACVECVNSRDCVAARKACDANVGSCVPCTTNEACASGLCTAGACANPSDLIYVKASGPSCPGGGTGTFDDPFCAVLPGILDGAAKGRTVIVFSGTYSENIIVQPTAAFNVRVVGIGQPTLAPSAVGPAFRVSNSAQAVNITLDGFVVQNATGGTGHGIDCGGSTAMPAITKLRILRSTVRNNAQIGIKSSGCDLSVDQVVIGPDNKQGGISVADSSVAIVNALDYGNGTDGSAGSSVGGMSMSGTIGAAKIVNSVFAANKARTGALVASGLQCLGTPIVFNVALRDNVGGSVEITASDCTPDHSAFVGAALMAGTNNLDLTTCSSGSIFANPAAGDYHPRTSGSAPCNLVNAGTPSFMGTSAPAYDLEGIDRPKQGAFDIGPYEAP